MYNLSMTKELQKTQPKKIVKLGRVGQPPKFKSPEQLQGLINDYFAECEKTGRSATMSGLAVSVGCSRETLLNYSKKDEYFGTLKSAKATIEQYQAELLLDKNTSPVGVIFSLKNNFGWRDDRSVTVTHQTIADITKNIEQGDVIDGELLDEDTLLLDNDD